MLCLADLLLWRNRQDSCSLAKDEMIMMIAIPRTPKVFADPSLRPNLKGMAWG